MRGLSSTLGVWLAFACATLAHAQQLAIRQYDVADGLANSRVSSIHQDRKGYLWFGTWEGLSRFDGYRFKNYGVRDGLGSLIVNTVVEDHAGRVWIGTNGGGIARVIDDATSSAKFARCSISAESGADNVNEIVFDEHDEPWCHTDAGLFRGRVAADGELRFEAVVRGKLGDQNWSRAACVDRDGVAWFAIRDELVCVEQGVARPCSAPIESPQRSISMLYADGDGTLFALYTDVLFALRGKRVPTSASDWTRVPLELAPSAELRCIFRDARGVLWIATSNGLIEERQERRRVYTTANGLEDDFIRSIAQDRDGNLWLATSGAGVAKLANESMVSFKHAQGLPDQDVERLAQGSQGEIYAVTQRGGIACIEDERVTLVPHSTEAEFARVGSRLLTDERGDFWLGNDEHLLRVPGPRLELERAQAIGRERGFTGAGVTSGPGLCFDAHGALWIASNDRGLFRLDRDADGEARVACIVPSLPDMAARLCVDRSDALWLASAHSLDRRVAERVTELGTPPGLPDTSVRAFLVDRRGWLWLGLRTRGVSVTRDPSAASPQFKNYSTLEGLASDTVWSIAEDQRGLIYLGTGRGVDRLDPETGAVRHWTSSEGLAGDVVHHCLRDRDGRMWFGTSGGVSRFDPGTERVAVSAPPVYLTRVQIAGEDLRLPETGARDCDAHAIEPARNNLLIEFVGLSFRGERRLAYQYMLDGIDAGWSAPVGQTSVNYARLSPGSYHFRVRAVDENGRASAEPATLSFTILPPVWRRWWFVVGCAVLAGSVAYGFHKHRIARVIALERIRRQIALDLHDDIGSGLSQIAIQAEVARRSADAARTGLGVGADTRRVDADARSASAHAHGDPSVSERLEQIAELARTMRDSMSDIVWSVDPRKDRVADLVARMRQIAFNVQALEGPRISFRALEEQTIAGITLAPDRRRHLLLMFKEALTNACKHAQASEIAIELGLARGALELVVRDDGRGFDTVGQRGAPAGHGLESLRSRASAVGARLAIASAPGNGTRIEVQMPLS